MIDPGSPAADVVRAARTLVRQLSVSGHHSTDQARRPVFIVYLPKAETEALFTDLEQAIARCDGVELRVEA